MPVGREVLSVRRGASDSASSATDIKMAAASREVSSGTGESSSVGGKTSLPPRTGDLSDPATIEAKSSNVRLDEAEDTGLVDRPLWPVERVPCERGE